MEGVRAPSISRRQAAAASRQGLAQMWGWPRLTRMLARLNPSTTEPETTTILCAMGQAEIVRQGILGFRARSTLRGSSCESQAVPPSPHLPHPHPRQLECNRTYGLERTPKQEQRLTRVSRPRDEDAHRPLPTPSARCPSHP